MRLPRQKYLDSIAFRCITGREFLQLPQSTTQTAEQGIDGGNIQVPHIGRTPTQK